MKEQGSDAPTEGLRTQLFDLGDQHDLAGTALEIQPVTNKGDSTSGRRDKNSKSGKFKKAPSPVLGESFGPQWGQPSLSWATLPGGGLIGFNLNRLTMADFRMMRDHYQINASLSVLAFMMHQLQWQIVCDNKTIKDFCTEQIANIWTRLVRSLSQAFWAGYSPNILQWENDVTGRRISLTKIKDLVPEEAWVNWREVPGWAPPGHIAPKIKVYDGIKTFGAHWHIPVENTLWYPLLMENGDHYGKKLLRPAFTPWFFSTIIHLFANRYFERFGEPTMIGRAPYDETLTISGEAVNARAVMLDLLTKARNGGAVVLPESRTVTQGSTQAEQEYTIEYLESQMRGADFERYLMRLDEEMSLALFTPLLMLRTADVGSYNLGTTHAQVYLQMLNALSGDWKEYIDNYILDRMVAINFGPNAKKARIQFRKLGDDRLDYVKTILQQLLARGTAKPDLFELGEIAGLRLEEVAIVTEPGADPQSSQGGQGDQGGPDAPDKPEKPEKPEKPAKPAAKARLETIREAMLARLGAQVSNAYRDGKIRDDFVPSLGYKRQLEEALSGVGSVATNLYSTLSEYTASFAGMEMEPREALHYISNGLRIMMEEACEREAGTS